MEHLQYPIGKFDKSVNHTFEDRIEAIDTLKALPEVIKSLTQSLSDEQLEKVYRPNGWTIRQVVHHIADSHANLYVRIKCALTEENPTIKGYSEADWALLEDSKLPVSASLSMIEGIHIRLVSLLENMTAADYDNTFFHNGYQATYVLKNVIQLYKWHSIHHTEHIKIALNS